MKNCSSILRQAIVKNLSCRLKKPEGVLTEPYLDPGGQYSKSLWDWDSYWSSVGLSQILRRENNLEKYSQQAFTHIKGSLRNFFNHQGRDGSLPICLVPTDSDVFKCRIRPGEETNMAKPIFGQFLWLIVKETGDLKLAAELFGKLLNFYKTYRDRYQHNTGLFVWGSDVAVAVDDDPAIFGRPNFSAAGIFLNCMMYADLQAASWVAKTLGKDRQALRLGWQAKTLAKSIRTYCWDERDGFFYSVDVQCQRQRHLGWLHKNLDTFWRVMPLKVMSWSGFLSLWAKLATPKQARRMIREHLLNPKRFFSPHGIRSLSADECMYDPTTIRGNPSNWLGPIWIIVQYLVWQGLLNYGYTNEAEEIARRTINLLEKDLKTNGYLHEYYDPKTGKGLCGRGFWNWNNLVYLMDVADPKYNRRGFKGLRRD